MKKIYSPKNDFKKLLLKKITNLLLVFLLVNFYTNLHAQNNSKNQLESITNTTSQYFKTISIGDKIDFGTIENSVSWTISKKDDEDFSKAYNGNEINSFVFEKAGIYQIVFNENKSYDKDNCHHSLFPEKMLVAVSPVKMTFDLTKVQFSKKIRLKQTTDGIMVTVPVTITMFDKNSFMFPLSNIAVSGIGVDIIGTPVANQIKIENGNQLISYKLSGFANKETLLMFDFLDVNNQVQSYTHLEIIK